MNRITEMSVLKNQEKVQKKINTDTFWLWIISYYRYKCIRKSYENTITTNWWSEMKTVDCMLHMKTNIHKIMIWHSWQKNVSNCWSTKIIKSISTRNKTSNNHQIRSQKSAIFHNNKKIEWMTSMMSRNFDRIWFYHLIL